MAQFEIPCALRLPVLCHHKDHPSVAPSCPSCPVCELWGSGCWPQATLALCVISVFFPLGIGALPAGRGLACPSGLDIVILKTGTSGHVPRCGRPGPQVKMSLEHSDDTAWSGILPGFETRGGRTGGQASHGGFARAEGTREVWWEVTDPRASGLDFLLPGDLSCYLSHQRWLGSEVLGSV